MPRRRKFTMPKNQTVTFDEAELRDIHAAARREGEPVSAFIRRLLLEALGKKVDR